MYESWLALFILNMASVIQLAQQVYMHWLCRLHLDLFVNNPRRACAARVTEHVLGLCVCVSVCLCVCVCVSVTQHLTFHVFIHATNDINLLSGG